MPRHRFGDVWQFETKRFTVVLNLERDSRYRYDGEDEDGSIQAGLDSGDLVAFNSSLRVEFDGETIGEDFLGGSVYKSESVAEFFTDHRSSDPANRNTLDNKEARIAIGHYFPDMVRTAIREARREISNRARVAAALPPIRKTGV